MIGVLRASTICAVTGMGLMLSHNPNHEFEEKSHPTTQRLAASFITLDSEPKPLGGNDELERRTRHARASNELPSTELLRRLSITG